MVQSGGAHGTEDGLQEDMVADVGGDGVQSSHCHVLGNQMRENSVEGVQDGGGQRGDDGVGGGLAEYVHHVVGCTVEGVGARGETLLEDVPHPFVELLRDRSAGLLDSVGELFGKGLAQVRIRL